MLCYATVVYGLLHTVEKGYKCMLHPRSMPFEASWSPSSSSLSAFASVLDPPSNSFFSLPLPLPLLRSSLFSRTTAFRSEKGSKQKQKLCLGLLQHTHTHTHTHTPSTHSRSDWVSEWVTGLALVGFSGSSMAHSHIHCICFSTPPRPNSVHTYTLLTEGNKMCDRSY